MITVKGKRKTEKSFMLEMVILIVSGNMYQLHKVFTNIPCLMQMSPNVFMSNVFIHKIFEKKCALYRSKLLGIVYYPSMHLSYLFMCLILIKNNDYE